MIMPIMFGGALLLMLGGAAYLVTRFHKFILFRRIAERSRLLSWLAAILPPALITALFALFINVTTAAVVNLHLILIWLICDLVGLIVRAISRKRRGDAASNAGKRYYVGAAAIAVTALYLGVGWFMAHHIFETNYEFTTDKALGRKSLRVALIADSHIGITLDGDDFELLVDRINQADPDVVAIVGDFVDDDSDAADMRDACRALGKLNAEGGVYFVFGNHDDGYFHYRNFGSQELRDALSENGVVILEDSSVLIDDSFYLVGRKDRSSWDRLAAEQLTETLDMSKYVIMLDHQPNDYANEAASRADLVLSGHTHGGHIFPAGQIGVAIGANDSMYGVQTRENTNFVVTSGVSGWAIPFKTGTFSEFVIIDISGK